MKLVHLQTIVTIILIAFFESCTDLEENILEEVIPDDLSQLDGAEASLLAGIYSHTERLFADFGNLWCLQQMSTDETVLPERGPDWGDGGKWKQIHEFTWTANSAKVLDSWRRLNTAVAQANNAINFLKDQNNVNSKLFLAEARGMWTLYTYNIADLFGQVPYRDPLDLLNYAVPTILSTQEAIDVCIQTLEEIIPNLAAYGEAKTHPGRFTKEAAYALLAKIYLNKAVYDDRYNASSNFDFASYMDKVITYTDLVINSGKFALESDYFKVFDVDNYKNSEHIFAVIQQVSGPNRGQNDITYSSMARIQKANPKNNRGVNATCITPDYYRTWEGNFDDPRFHKHTLKNGGEPYRNDGEDISLPYDRIFHFNRGFQEGQQFGPLLNEDKDDFERDPADASRVLIQQYFTEKSPSTPLDFTIELNFSNPSSATFVLEEINRGVRVFKQEYDAEGGRRVSGMDWPIFRLGGVYTMRAEAKFRSGDIEGALADINLLRTSRWSIDIDGNQYFGTALTSLDEETLYNEISYELYWEGERRLEMIRFGTYENPYTAKPTSEPFRRIFPIPQSELDINPDFDQNIGY